MVIERNGNKYQDKDTVNYSFMNLKIQQLLSGPTEAPAPGNGLADSCNSYRIFGKYFISNNKAAIILYNYYFSLNYIFILVVTPTPNLLSIAEGEL
jgi:hypothetical protein